MKRIFQILVITFFFVFLNSIGFAQVVIDFEDAQHDVLADEAYQSKNPFFPGVFIETIFNDNAIFSGYPMVVRAHEGSIDCGLDQREPPLTEPGTVGGFDSRFCSSGNTTKNFPTRSGFNSLRDTSELMFDSELGKYISIADVGGTRYQDGFRISFDYPVNDFSVSFADWGDYFPNGVDVNKGAYIQLEGYDSEGNSLGTSESTPLFSIGADRDAAEDMGIIEVVLDAESLRIVDITFKGGIDPGVTIDDVTFMAPSAYNLCAGQFMNVGEVQVLKGEETLYVRYLITNEDWCITETHLDVATSPEDIDQKNGNPIPGKFEKKGEHDCVQEVVYEYSLADFDLESAENLFIAAHAVVKDTSAVKCDYDEEQAFVYGIQRNNGIVSKVDVVSGNSEDIFTISDVPAGSAKPNGLAYDSANDRLYFCDYQLTTTLYFWDGVQKVAGPLTTGEIAAAAFYNGKYYYITGPPASDDLYEVAFNTDGTMADGYPTKIADIDDDAGLTHGWTFNGDIAIKEGVLYGWGLCSHGYEFFTYDLFNGIFTVNKTNYQASLQLAFGSDGTLYGHRSGDDGPFFIIDTTEGNQGNVTPIGSPSGLLFTDCASGMRCQNVLETAWGNSAECGDAETSGFSGKNWATYIEFPLE